MKILALSPMMELMPVAWLQARITHARMNGMTYLRLSRGFLPAARPFADALFLRGGWPPFPGARFPACVVSAAKRSKAARAASLRPRRIEPARRFSDDEAAEDEEHARRQRYPENAAPRGVSEIMQRGRVAQFRHGVDPVAGNRAR